MIVQIGLVGCERRKDVSVQRDVINTFSELTGWIRLKLDWNDVLSHVLEINNGS